MRLGLLCLVLSVDALAAGAPSPTQVVTGDHHACAIVDGQVRCWGGNNRGQLGDGTRHQRLAPVAVVGSKGAVAVAACGDASCAVDATGAVTCWGTAAPVAPGADDPYAPRVIAGVRGATTVALADVGLRACAIVKAGEVVCWTRRSAPAAVVGVRGAVELAVLGTGGCARAAAGRLSCWTWPDPAKPTSTSAQAVGIDDAQAIAPTSDGKQIVALRRGGRASRFDIAQPGRLTTLQHVDAARLARGAGELGITSAGKLTRVLPVEPPPTGMPELAPSLPLPPLVDVQSVAASREIFWERRFACAIRRHELVCWGDNVVGVLADGQADRYGDSQPVPKLTHVAQIAVGEGHVCARRDDGTVTCWGREAGGMPFAPSPLARFSPVEVDGVKDAIDLAVGMFTSCAVRRSGGVVCWGSSDEIPTEARRAPGPLGDIADAVQLHGDAAYACVARRNGAVACHTAGDHWPGKEPWRNVAGLDGAVEVRFQDGYYCARKKSGEVACWERNQTPRRVEGIGDAVQLAVLQNAGCVRKKSGEVVCWYRVPPTDADGVAMGPQTIAAGAVDIGGGRAITVALADGSAGRWSESRARGVERMPLAGVAAFSAGTHGGCALRTDRSVACWGENLDGQLGIGSPTRRRDEPRAVSFVAGTPATRCADGVIAACAQGTTLSDKAAACAADSAPACDDIARRYFEGDGLPKNPAMASWVWGDLCAESEYLDACRAMAKHGNAVGALNVLQLVCLRGNQAACAEATKLANSDGN